MSPVEVHVEIAGGPVLAGSLWSHRRGRAESATFAYAPAYLANPSAYALDPTLPPVGGSQQTPLGAALFGALADCAPDRWGRTLLLRREVARARQEGRAPRSLGEVDLLLGVRDDLRQGALRLRRGGGPFLADESSGVPALTDLPSLLDLADRADGGTTDLSDLQRLVRAGSSLGGARPKAHVVDAAGRLSIAKLPSASSDTWDVMAWEKVVLDLARTAGVTVPPSRLLDLAGRSVLVVERFDRSASRQRIGYVSAMTLLEAGDGDRRSYVDLAEVVEEVSDRVTADLHELWRRIVLTVLVSNSDDHLRNHGFLHVGHGRWRLSPVFDVNPDPSPGPTHLATSIDGSDDRASLGSALAVADVFRLDGDAAAAVVAQVRSAVGRWRDVAGGHGLTPSAIEAMAPAFAAAEQEDA